MTKIIVTGATGNIGRLTLQHLLSHYPAEEVVGLAREPGKAADLAAQGIEIRCGDYFDLDSLLRAFKGVEKLMLVSATAFTDRNTQHRNVIKAAKQAGIRHIVFMPIIRKEDSSYNLPQVTDEDLIVEADIKASGLTYTLVRHPPFLESIEFYLGGNVQEAGVHVPIGSGKAAYASRSDLAEAHATVLSQTGHENKTYDLYGNQAISFAGVASMLSDISGKEVPYVGLTDQDYVSRLVAAGLPAPAADFALSWIRGINSGEWDSNPGDLERLLGRKPTTPTEYLRNSLGISKSKSS